MPESNNKRKNGKVPVKQVAKKASKRDTFIAEAKDIRAACLGLIGNSAQIKELIIAAKSNPEVKLDEVAVGALANTLARDLNALKIELDNIDKQCMSEIDAIDKKTSDIEVMNITISVGSRYQQWQDRFINLTAPTMEQITELCAGNLGE